VVHGAASLAFLLVIKVEAHAFALQEGGKGCQMGDNLGIANKSDIHLPKLHGVSRFSGRCHGIFAWTKEEEKGNND
jgi:hypothetical protein